MTNRSQHIRLLLQHIQKIILNFRKSRQFSAIRVSIYIKGGKNMDWIQELVQAESLHDTLTAFLKRHGVSGLEEALRLYSNRQKEYMYKSKTAITRIKIADIYYLEIRTHTITIHTQHGTYQKYGSLTDEQKLLSPYGFIKCNQSCLVSLDKIQSICNNTITLTNQVQLHMSQRYTPKILVAFTRKRTLK